MGENRKPLSAMNILRAGTVSLALTCAGCAVYHSETTGGFSGAGIADLGAGSGIPFQVDGSVAGVRGSALAAAVGAGMPATIESKTVHYIPCAPYTECAGDHVVWTFGPPPMRSSANYPSALHFNPAWIGSYRPATTRVAATVSIFQGGALVSTAAGQVDAPEGVNDPAFKAMISELSGTVLSTGLLGPF